VKSLVDRERVAELVRSTLSELAVPALAAPTMTADAGGGLHIRPDRGTNLGAPFDADALRAQLGSTPARIAVGRAGTRYRTNTLLRFRADHAAAKDAVFSEVDSKLVQKAGLTELETRAKDKREFLQRPDLGRTLSPESQKLLGERALRAPTVQVCYGDGLSAAALNAHLEAFHGALERALAAKGVKTGTPLFIRHSRVKVMDEIARLVDAEACVFVCGERPGLGFSDSLSAYYIYRPASGATDADREVISNINPRGLEPIRAAEVLAQACVRVLAAKKSGVVLGT
jgi:ethanolamine ammonia-lyase small subunit